MLICIFFLKFNNLTIITPSMKNFVTRIFINNIDFFQDVLGASTGLLTPMAMYCVTCTLCSAQGKWKKRPSCSAKSSDPMGWWAYRFYCWRGMSAGHPPSTSFLHELVGRDSVEMSPKGLCTRLVADHQSVGRARHEGGHGRRRAALRRPLPHATDTALSWAEEDCHRRLCPGGISVSRNQSLWFQENEIAQSWCMEHFCWLKWTKLITR